MDNPLVSIIIPTYNRAHLIGETLDSVLAQTYQNWECLVVDDGSSDTTDALIATYKTSDVRFQYLHRPSKKIKGASACRNVGLEAAQGDYIIFFDSDDVMTPDHIMVKVLAMQSDPCDYVITRTEFLKGQKEDNENNYRFHLYPLTTFNYVSQAINWLTPDACIKRNMAKSIQFNESLHAGQEFNYFSKLVHQSVNARFVNKTVTLRRSHNDSIHARLDTPQKSSERIFRTKWITYLELIDKADRDTRRELLKSCASALYEGRLAWNWNKLLFTKAILKEYGFRSMYYFLLVMNLRMFGKGYYFYKKLTRHHQTINNPPNS
ncbi:glycosyltransferase family 2 protein [Gelidibacter japonicus]|uniref:glycosyltransferase family 2 protein n=1 Tax=Gelidibacter japonicus TaxID=1962232 RepID=UPI003A94FC20